MKQGSTSRERRVLRALHARGSGLQDFIQRTGWSDFYAAKPRRRKRSKNNDGRCLDTIDMFAGTEWAAPTQAEAAHQFSNPSPEKGAGHD